jgi:hypothetical protein
MRRSLLKRASLVPLLLLLAALIAAACGGGSDDGSSDELVADSAAAQTAQTDDVESADGGDDREAPAASAATAQGDAEGAYENDVKRIVDAVQADLDEVGLEFLRLFLLQLDGVDTDDDQAVAEALAEVLLTFADDVTGLISEGLDELDALALPDRFAEDHRLFVDSRRALAALQADAFETIAREGFDLETGFDAINAETDALEAELQAALSPDFLLLVAAFFADANLGDLAPLDVLDNDDSVTLTDGDQAVSIGGDPVDGFPPILVPADSTLETSASELTESGTLYFAVWQSNQEPMDLLNFFEIAFEALGVDEEPERIELGGLYTLEYGGGDPDTTVATVFIAANEEVGGYSVVMQYLDPS